MAGQLIVQGFLYTKFTAKTPILDKIDENTENSNLSIESENFELKISKGLTKISRLCGGSEKMSNRKSGGKDPNTTSGNKDTIKETEDLVTGTNTQEETIIHYSPEAIKEIEYQNDEEKEEKKTQISADNGSEMKKENHSVNVSPVAAEDIKYENEDDRKKEKKNEILANSNNEEKNSRHADNKLEDMISNNKNKEQDVTAVKNEANDIHRNELVTTSFADDLLNETVLGSKKEIMSPPDTKYEKKDFVPSCGVRYSPRGQCARQKIKPTDLFRFLPPNEELCERIENLEKQVGQINSALEDLQNELVPPEDLAKFNVISRRFDEVNNVLAELKFNCVKLKNVESQINDRGYPAMIEENQQSILNFNSDNYDEFSSPNMYMEPCNCKIYYGDESCVHEGTCPLRLNCYNSPISRLAVHRKANNVKIPQVDKNYCCNQQQDYTEKNELDTSGEQRDYRTSPSDLYKNVSALNSRFHHSKKENHLTKSPQRVEDNKNVSTDWNASHDNSKKGTKANRARSQKTHLHSLPRQRSFSEPRQIVSPSQSKKEINSKEFSSLPKEYVNKIRPSAGRDNFGNESGWYVPDSSTRVTKSNTYQELPLITHNLSHVIWNIIGNTSSDNIALTVFLERNNLYHINIAVIQTGQCLGCVYTNEAAFEEAKKKKLFENFFVFLVLNSDNTLEERNKVLGYSFEFININD